MTYFVHDDVLENGITEVSSNANAMHVCTGDPADRAAAIAASLATVAPTYDAPADGDASGRKIRSQAKNAVSLTATGLAAHTFAISMALGCLPRLRSTRIRH